MPHRSTALTVGLLLSVAVAVACAASLGKITKNATPTPVDVGCPDCAHRDGSGGGGGGGGGGESDPAALAVARIELVKHQILEKLRLAAEPNVSQPLPRQVLLQALGTIEPTMVDESSDDEQRRRHSQESDYYAQTKEIISFSEPGERTDAMDGVRFSTAYEHPDTLQVLSARLWLLLRFKSVYLSFLKEIFSHRKVTLEVYEAGNGSSLSGLAIVGTRLRKLATVHVPLQRAGWMSIDLPVVPVQAWFDGPVGQKLDVFVLCVDCGAFIEPVVITQPADVAASSSSSSSNETTATPPGGKNIGDSRPFLVMQTKAKPATALRRTKRSVDCRDGTAHCCRMPFYVNFTDIGWDKWIIAPPGYQAYHCTGSCDVAFDPERNFHTQILDAHRLRNFYSKVQPCCYPKRLSPMKLIYLDPDTNIVEAVLPNMVVEECGCA